MDTIRRRFDAGRLNFQSIYRPRVDSWLLFDNSGEMPLLMEEGDNT
jgi:predicted ABC-type ATPase